MRVALASLAVTVVVLLAFNAQATVGGPDTVEILGYEASEGKLFVVKTFGGEGEWLPQPYYVFTQGEHTGRIERVCSVFKGVSATYVPEGCERVASRRPSEDTSLYTRRLEAIKKRLAAVKDMPISAFAIASHPKRGAQEAVPADENGFTKAPVAVSVRAKKRGGAGVTKTLRAFVASREEQPTLALAARIPGISLAVVTVRYLGIPFESGYMIDAVFLVPLSR